METHTPLTKSVEEEAADLLQRIEALKVSAKRLSVLCEHEGTAKQRDAAATVAGFMSMASHQIGREF